MKRSTIRAEHTLILAACLERQRAVAAEPKPLRWQYFERERWEEETEHGPRYAPSEWFGSLAEHERLRFRRAIDDLERAGLLEVWKRHGRRMSNIRLTEEGVRVAEGLPAAPSVLTVSTPDGSHGSAAAACAGEGPAAGANGNG